MAKLVSILDGEREIAQTLGSDIPGLKTQPYHLCNFGKVTLPFEVLFVFNLPNGDDNA